MSRQLEKHTTYVYREHRLSRFAVHQPPLKIGDVEVSSLAVGHAYVVLRMHGRHDLAVRILRNNGLRNDPGGTDAWLEKERFVPDAVWCFGSRHVYLAIMVDQLTQPGSSFKKEFENLANVLSKKPHQFVVCSSARDQDYYWSCGLRFSGATSGCHMAGANVYGRQLDKLLDGWRTGRYPIKFSLDFLLSGAKPPDSFAYPKHTVLVLGDSQNHPFRSIQGGRCISGGGALFRNIASLIRQRNINLGDYSYVIVNCGVNDAQRSEVEQKQSWAAFWSAVQRYANGNQPEILISLAVMHPDEQLKRAIISHSEYISRQLEGTSVKCVNWVEEENDAFMDIQGNQNKRLFDEEGRTPYFHINHAGIRELWRKWCSVLPELSHVQYELQPVIRTPGRSEPDRESSDMPGTSHNGKIYRGAKRKKTRTRGGYSRTQRPA